MRTSRYRAEPRPTHALNNALFLLHFHAGLQLCGRSSADLLACSKFREHRHQRPRPSSSYPNRLAFTFVAYPVSVIAINGRSRVRGPETYDAALAAICQSLAHRFDGSGNHLAAPCQRYEQVRVSPKRLISRLCLGLADNLASTHPADLKPTGGASATAPGW